MDCPWEVVIAGTTLRDGFQHEENSIPAAAKRRLAEQLMLPVFGGSK